jgi:hypothetical protein
MPRLEPLEDRSVPTTVFVETEPNDTIATANLLSLGFDAGQDTHVTVKGTISPLGDRDRFLVELNAGDVIGGVAVGKGAGDLDPLITFASLDGAGGATLLVLNNDGWLQSLSLPPESPLPRSQPTNTSTFSGPLNTDAVFYYVVSAPGVYMVSVRDGFDATGVHSTGDYHLDLVVARPGLERQPLGTRQIVFVDFDGATTSMKTGAPARLVNRTLSPLASFLSRWGLSPADENAVIDATIATIRENLSEDVRQFGLNGDFAATHNPGDFDIDIRNSRDHADEFGVNPFVARIAIGGTLEEVGFPPSIPLIAFAQNTDPGNFKTDDEAFVLLDHLSAAASDPDHPFSLNRIPIAAPHTKIEMIGRALGDIASHELGHLFGNRHTFPFETFNIMDEAVFLAVGPDGVFGTQDDVDVDFGTSDYSFLEGLFGIQDTLNVIAFGLSTGKGETRGAASSGNGSGSFIGTSNVDEACLAGPHVTGLFVDVSGLLVGGPWASALAPIVSPNADTSCDGGKGGNRHGREACNDDTSLLQIERSIVAENHADRSDGGELYNLGLFDFDVLSVIFENYASHDDVFDPFA